MQKLLDASVSLTNVRKIVIQPSGSQNPSSTSVSTFLAEIMFRRLPSLRELVGRTEDQKWHSWTQDDTGGKLLENDLKYEYWVRPKHWGAETDDLQLIPWWAEECERNAHDRM